MFFYVKVLQGCKVVLSRRPFPSADDGSWGPPPDHVVITIEAGQGEEPYFAVQRLIDTLEGDGKFVEVVLDDTGQPPLD